MDTRRAGDMRINFVDIGETIAQRRRRSGVIQNCGPLPERRSTISSAMTSSYQVTRMRNLSGGSSGSTASGSSSGSSTQFDNQYSTDNSMYFSMDISPFANSSAVPQPRGDSSSHRKLDRSLSDGDSSNTQSQRSVNSSRYKTELCRPFEESGSCKYGDKCQFAHGMHELRNLARHPKYKTEFCRTFHTIGFCPYGPRCHFIHEDDKTDGTTKETSGSSSPSLSPTGSDHDNFSYSESNSVDNTRVNNSSLTVNINTFGNVDVQSLEQRFDSALNLNARNAYNNSTTTCKSSDEYDIFSCISVFNPEEVVVDNAPRPSSNTLSYPKQQQSLDNCPTYVDTSCFWPSNVSSQGLAPVDPFHYSPTGSTGSSSSSGSDSGSSDCSGSTESLASSGYRDWHPPHMPLNLVY